MPWCRDWVLTCMSRQYEELQVTAGNHSDNLCRRKNEILEMNKLIQRLQQDTETVKAQVRQAGPMRPQPRDQGNVSRSNPCSECSWQGDKPGPPRFGGSKLCLYRLTTISSNEPQKTTRFPTAARWPLVKDEVTAGRGKIFSTSLQTQTLNL